MRESAVVKKLKAVVRELRGTTRKVKWEGRRHAPDLLVLLPLAHCMVETKATDKQARAGQAREHARLRASGMPVFVINSEEQIDQWRREFGDRPLAYGRIKNG